MTIASWIITLELKSCHQDPEYLDSVALELVEDGASGTSLTSPTTLSVFFEGSSEELSSYLSENISEEIFAVAYEPLVHELWVQKCELMLEPVQAGLVRIFPVESAEKALSLQPHPGDLLIIPGLGFGTGHHETTRTALILLQHEYVKQAAPKRILDVGTGSGILAIAAAKLFQAEIIAFDTDSMAIDNAVENSRINSLEHAIIFFSGTIERCSGSFDLLIANIYAEILCELESTFETLLSSGTLLIISGIMASRVHLIDESFTSACWKNLEHREENGWVSRLYKRM